MSDNFKISLEDQLTFKFNFNKSTWSLSLKQDIDSDMLAGVQSFYSLYLNEGNGNIDPTLYVMSVGGDLFSTFGIVDLMNYYKDNFKITTNTIVIGPAFSGASVIAVSGTGTRSIGRNSYLMIHDISNIIDRAITATDIQQKNIYVTEIQDRYLNMFTAKSSLTIEDLKLFIRNDRYFNAEESLKYKLVDKIL